jgi:anti-sigma factor RsiW
MANERQKRLMQQALDAELAPEERAELQRQLDADSRTAAMYQNMQQVDTMLRNPPHERAPRRLAETIMARLSEMAELMDPRQLSRISGLALALSLGLVAGVLLPVLVAAAWLLISGLTSGAGIAAALTQVVALLAVVLGIFETSLTQLRAFLTANPALIVVMLGLIPVSLVGLLRLAPRKRRPAQEEELYAS